MTKEEVIKHGISSVIGLCELCSFRNSCKDIEIDFNKPKDCNGPYDRYADQIIATYNYKGLYTIL